MSILGIDPSLTATGFSYRSDGDRAVTGRIVPKDLRGQHRLSFVRERFAALLDKVAPTLVVYEGYAMNTKFGRLGDLGELGGVLKMEMYDTGIPHLLVPPSNLKLFVTGHGGGRGKEGKELMMRTLAKHRRRLFTSNDEADAYGLMLMGEAWVNPRSRPRDRRHHANRALQGSEFIQ